MINWLLFFLFSFVTPVNEPSQVLVNVLEYFAIPHSSWEEIVDETQKRWLRKPGQELWNMAPQEDPSPEKTYVLFKELGMTETLHACKKNYDYVVIFGVTLQEMRKRISFLKNECVVFKQLVFLVGDRPLDPKKEAGYGKSETEMAKKLFNETRLPEWNDVIFVDTPKKEGKNRPDTADTIEHWLTMTPEPGSILFISGQPFILRQEMTAKKLMPPSFCIETVGNGFSCEEYKQHPRGLPILLDELARLIYQSRRT